MLWAPCATMQRMVQQGGATLGEALSSQAKLARELGADPGQVSRWVTNKATPQPETVRRIEEFLGVDLSGAIANSASRYELYVSAPITGLGKRHIGAHHQAVAEVVEEVRKCVEFVYWPGEGISDQHQLVAPDIATERNMKVLAQCPAFLFLQFGEILHPSSALIELGIALGRRIRTTMILNSEVAHAYMLKGFDAVAAGSTFLPKARTYPVDSTEQACDLIEKNGRELLGLPPD
jgi:transcriptional regulator with XRE-family HTH domain